MKLHRSQAKKLKRMISDDELQAHFQSEFYKHLDEEARKETINRITQNWLRFEEKNED
jgi:hypothetical protein